VDGQSNTLTGRPGSPGLFRCSSAEKWEQFERQRRAANDGLPRENLDATSDLALRHLAACYGQSGAYRPGSCTILTSFVLIRWMSNSLRLSRYLGRHASSGGNGDHVKVRVARDTPCPSLLQ